MAPALVRPALAILPLHPWCQSKDRSRPYPKSTPEVIETATITVTVVAVARRFNRESLKTAQTFQSLNACFHKAYTQTPREPHNCLGNFRAPARSGTFFAKNFI